MRLTAVLWLMMLAMIVAVGPGAGIAQAGDKPNVVFILADDFGFGDVQVNNPHSEIPTPNLNRLAEQGRNFTNAHTTSGVCTPTRYSVLTGRYNWRSRMKKWVLGGWSRPLIQDDRMTVATVLKQNGYHTAVVGKWHLGLGWQGKDTSKKLTAGPTTIGFDESFIVPASLDMSPYCYVSNLEVVNQPTEKVKGHVFGRPGVRAPDMTPENALPKLTERAQQVITSHAKKRYNKSLFLYFPLTAPHKPVAPSKRFQGKTDLGEYGDFVHEVDWVVGQIMQTLDEAGIADDTILIVTGDNGASPNAARSAVKKGHMPNWPYRGGKTTLWEGGHREPFIVRWPGQVEPGTESDALVSVADLMATCADLVGYDLPDDAGEDSHSFLTLLQEDLPDAEERQTAIYHSGSGHFAIQMGKWKLITVKDGAGWDKRDWGMPKHSIDQDMPMQLYNMEEDTYEKNNLYDEHPAIVEKLKAELIRQVNRGRSTPGTPQRNDGGGKNGYWGRLNTFMSKDQYKNHELAPAN
jgi:arylsulfatase A-like enzyme